MKTTKKLLGIDDSVPDEDTAFALATVAKALKVIALRLYKLASLIEQLISASKDCFRTCRAPFAYGSFNLCDTIFLKLGEPT